MIDFLKKPGLFHFTVGLILLSMMSYLLVFSPKLKEIRRLQAEVAARETEMGNAIRLWSEMVQTPGQETRRWEERLREWREKVPETAETDRLMAEISRKAVLHNLRAIRLIIPSEGKAEKSSVARGPGSAPEKPGPEKTKAFGELRLQLTFLSTYRDMAEFVEGVPKMKRLLSVRNLTVKEKDGEMETAIELSAFYGKPK